MKYLVFNLAVAAALVYLFAADRTDVRQVAARAHEAAGDAKAQARRVVDAGRTMLDDAVRTPPAEPAPQAVAAHVPAVPAAPAVAKPAVATPQPSAPGPAAARVSPPRAKLDATAMEPPPIAMESPAVDPAVAQRRAEVLAGLPPRPPVSRPVLKSGETLMSAGDRRRELMSLAEEMELLYARSVSR